MADHRDTEEKSELSEMVDYLLYQIKTTGEETDVNSYFTLVELVTEAKISDDHHRIMNAIEATAKRLIYAIEGASATAITKLLGEANEADNKAREEAETAIKEAEKFMASKSANEEKPTETTNGNGDDPGVKAQLSTLQFVFAMMPLFPIPPQSMSELALEFAPTAFNMIVAIEASSLITNPETAKLCQKAREFFSQEKEKE